MLDQFDPANRGLFEGIQGNILKSHGRHHTRNVFIRCHEDRQPQAKAWLRSLVDSDDSIIKSCYAQLKSNVLWKDKKLDTGLFACIHISAAGYRYLFGDQGADGFDDGPFKGGMKDAPLNDPPSSDWEEGLAVDNHFMLLLADANPTRLAETFEKIAATVPPFAVITAVEKGEALFNKEGAGLEHFGYVDGVSQPLFFEEEWEQYQKDNNIRSAGAIRFDPRADKKLVLTQDPFFQTDPHALGSYFVFRKLEQNVKGFKQAESALANSLGLDDHELAGAMLVGRFEDGTPVEDSKDDGLINSSLHNNFDYNINVGSKCPFHGHIRKTNPRSSMPPESGGLPESKSRIMARRGIPFGTRTDDPNDGHVYNKPEGDVGLLFMSYQASIDRQFQFIQAAWANEPGFPHFDPAKADGIDPIIGQGTPRVHGDIATTWGNATSLKPAAFEQFVHMKGGEYFFAPSMQFLKDILDL